MIEKKKFQENNLKNEELEIELINENIEFTEKFQNIEKNQETYEKVKYILIFNFIE